MIYITTDLIGLILLGIGLFAGGIMIGGYGMWKLMTTYEETYE